MKDDTTPHDTPCFEKKLSRARELHERGQIKEALQQVNDCISEARHQQLTQTFEYFQALMFKASLHNQLFEPNEVINTYEEALLLTHVIPDADKEQWITRIELGLGRMHYYLFNHHQAMRHFENVRATTREKMDELTTYFRASFNYAVCQYYLGDFESALSVFKESTRVLELLSEPSLKATTITINTFIAVITYLLNANEIILNHNKRIILNSIKDALNHNDSNTHFQNNACWSLNLLLNLYLKFELLDDAREIITLMKELLEKYPQVIRNFDFDFARYLAMIGDFQESWRYFNLIYDQKRIHLPKEIEIEGEFTRAMILMLDYSKIPNRTQRLEKARSLLTSILDKATLHEHVEFQVRSLLELIKIDLDLNTTENIEKYLRDLLSISSQRKIVLIELIAHRLMIRYLIIKNNLDTAATVLTDLKQRIKTLDFINPLFRDMIKEEEVFLEKAVMLQKYDEKTEQVRPSSETSLKELKEYLKEVEKYLPSFN